MVLGYFVNFLATSGYEAIETGTEPKKSKTKASIKDMGKALGQNPHLIALIIGDIPKYVIRFVPSAVAAYYVTYVAEPMGYKGLLPMYILLTGIGAMVGAFISQFLAKTFGTRNATIGTYCVMAVALFLAYFNYRSPWFVIAMMTIAQLGQGVCYSLAIALFGDCAVYSHWKTGADSRGFVIGLNTLSLKISIIGRPVILNTSLALVGFNAAKIKADPSLVTPELQRGITAALAFIPGIIVVVGILVFLF
jgi:GPH family glycoside/pentoside/hexuronide:cation symporter